MTLNGRHSTKPSQQSGTADILRIDALELECGETLRQAPVAYQTWGSLNDAGTNAVLICHALTGSSDVAAWWPGIVGPGLAIDTERYFVVCANVLGSPYGSASPLAVDPDTERPYGPRFPKISIRDTVAAHRVLLDRLGVRRVVAAIGASMGGMQVLEWAFEGDLVQSLIPIAVGGRHSAWCISWSEAQRQAIYADPNWLGGDYDTAAQPEAGLAAARMMAMVSYRSPDEFAGRFGRDTMPERDETGQPIFAAESYLRHQGRKLVDRFDANCYVQLTKQMDTHDVSRGRGSYEAALGSIKQPCLAIGISSDVLYPVAEQRELARTIPNARLKILESPYGHDSFLIETDAMSEIVRDWLETQSGQPASRPGNEYVKRMNQKTNRHGSADHWIPLLRPAREQAV
ncbi:MAG: homoserine O-acetyltransferase [Rhodothermia bacterium]|nr:homoserine O-acetyltransferase [Rhodothermia bacterium]